MFTIKLRVKQFLADVPIQLPLDVLLALPDCVTRDEGAPRFNLLAVMGRLFGRAGWDRASKVLNPRIWSPGWDESQLQRFATSTFLDRPDFLEKVWIEGLREFEFPRVLPETDLSNLQGYDIVHFAGWVHNRERGPILVLNEEGQALSPGQLRRSLVASQTRLLILQVPRIQFEDAASLAQSVTEGGGPAAVVVSGRDPGIVDAYLLNLYANLIHNKPLSLLAQPEDWMINQRPLNIEEAKTQGMEPPLVVKLFHGEDGEDLLRFDNYVDSLRARLQSAKQASQERRDNLSLVLFEREAYLHTTQVDDLKNAIDETREHDLIISDGETKLSGIWWDHESEGVVPTSEVKESIELVTENATRYAALESDLRADAPRVFNANFFDEEYNRFIKKNEGLRADHEYRFLVDIGPVWDRNDSIVSGKSGFPEKALPQQGEGYLVEAVLISEDFRPRVASALMWVPRGGGRSFPCSSNGERSEKSGPTALLVRMPPFPEEIDDDCIQVRGRICIYYENNLLQSGIVKVGVVSGDDVMSTEENTIEMDFALTGSFQNLRARYAKREIVSAPGGKAQQLPVTLNVTLNDDGAGNHRILVKGRQGSTAWTRYDPADARTTLDGARRTLTECFFKKDEKNNGNPTNEIGLAEGSIGQTKKQFLWDLVRLTYIGRDLWNRAFGGAILEDRMARAEWEAEVRAALAEGGVIQVARTGPANYAYPWALLYEYPLSTVRRENKFCRIVNEWSDDGIRRRPPERRPEEWPGKFCPYHKEGSHKKNVFCPYGFWGLKQIIEQPLSALLSQNGNLEPGDTPGDLHFTSTLDMAVAVTDDLPPEARRKHLTTLRGIKHIRFDPDLPADDFYSVQRMLRAPLVVYFLCHGEYDRDKRRPYLSIGKRDNADVHKIYPNTLQDWASAHDLDIKEWKRRRPLIFINGCHTADLVPGEVLNFVTPFSDSRASGVIGTEINILLPVAAEVSESLFRKISAGISIGEALQQTRWELVHIGNLLGLAYTIYCLASLRVVSDATQGS